MSLGGERGGDPNPGQQRKELDVATSKSFNSLLFWGAGDKYGLAVRFQFFSPAFKPPSMTPSLSERLTEGLVRAPLSGQVED